MMIVINNISVIRRVSSLKEYLNHLMTDFNKKNPIFK
jgi:hypothetical protein